METKLVNSNDTLNNTDYKFPEFVDWKELAIKTAIALSSDVDEADEYVSEFSKITELSIPDTVRRFLLKTQFVQNLFNIRKAAAFSDEVIDTKKAAEDDYFALLTVVLELKWG